MKKINVVQFAAYFPPHKWGYETHAYQRAKHWTKEGFWKITTVTFSVWQIQKGVYSIDGFEVLVLPAFEIISTFPFPKFRHKDFRAIIKKIKTLNADIYQTRTRFFVSSIIWGVLAKLHKKTWIHIEHGVDYIKLNAWWKNSIARLYDQTLGRMVFTRSNYVFWLSHGCRRFAEKFTKKEISVIHRGVEFIPEHNDSKKSQTTDKKNEINVVFVGRLVKLKWVDLIIEAIGNSQNVNKSNIHLHIIGDGEERKKLERQAKQTKKLITFHGFQSKSFLEQFLPQMDIWINASYQEWLPTSVVEWLMSKLIMIATNVGGTPEISDKEDLILIKPWSTQEIQKALAKAIKIMKTKKGKSLKSVRENFSRSKNIQTYYNKYQEIVTKGSCGNQQTI